MPVGTLVYAARCHNPFFGTVQETPKDAGADAYTWVKPLIRPHVWEGIPPKNVWLAVWTFAGPSVL